MKVNEGFALLRSLLTMAGILICIAAFYTALAIGVRQSGHLENRLREELSLRRGKIIERVR